MKHHLGPQWNLVIHTCSSFHRTTITLSSFSTFYCFWLCRMFPPLASIKHTEKWTPLRSSNNHAELHTYFKIQLVFVLQSLAQACSVHSSLSSILFSCFHLPTDDVFFFFHTSSGHVLHKKLNILTSGTTFLNFSAILILI